MKKYTTSILFVVFAFSAYCQQSYTAYKIDNGTLDLVSKKWVFGVPEKCNIPVKIVNGTFLINDSAVFISDNIPVYNKKEQYSITTFNGVDKNNRFGQVSLTNSPTISTIDFVLRDTCFVLFIKMDDLGYQVTKKSQ
jgi:hypothetical protein